MFEVEVEEVVLGSLLSRGPVNFSKL